MKAEVVSVLFCALGAVLVAVYPDGGWQMGIGVYLLARGAGYAKP